MIVDCHTHMWKFPEHLSASLMKFIKTERYRGSTGRGPEWEVTPEKYLAALSSVDKAIVHGLNVEGFFNVPNDYIAEFVNSYPDRLIGFAYINPIHKGAVKEIKRCTEALGLRGVKLHPTTQRFSPNDRRAYPVYATAEEMGLPIMAHAGAAGPGVYAPLKYCRPIDFEDVAYDFPDLKIIVAHMGIPWEAEALALIRKQPNVYTDISGMAWRPFRFYQNLVMAMEYGVLDKLLFGSDYPYARPDEHIKLLRDINVYTENTNLPKIPDEAIRCILEENAKKALNL